MNADGSKEQNEAEQGQPKFPHFNGYEHDNFQNMTRFRSRHEH